MTTSVALARESEQRILAEQREQQAQDARAEAQRQAEIAQAINDIYVENLVVAVFDSFEQGKGKDVLMREVLDKLAKRIEETSIAGGRYEGKPLIEASLRAMVGEMYWLFREVGAAEPHLERARVLQRRELGEEHPTTLRTLSMLAEMYYYQGRYDKAEPLFVKTLEIQKRVLGEDHRLRVRSMTILAALYRRQGRMNDAQSLLRATDEMHRRRANRPGASANDKNTYAWILLTDAPADLRDPETALRLAREASAMTNHAEPVILDTLALAQHLTGDTAAAIETEKKALSLLPSDAPRRGEYEAALAKFEAALKDESK